MKVLRKGHLFLYPNQQNDLQAFFVSFIRKSYKNEYQKKLY